MRVLRKLLILSTVMLLVAALQGCTDDCDTYCGNQGRFINQCLPQFDQQWPDIGDGSWANRGDFISACTDEIDTFIEDDIEATCAEAEEGKDRRDCENTVRSGTVASCGEHVNDFNRSCVDYWSDATIFEPTIFAPIRPEPTGDDDDSSGDDDDSSGDDDDSSADDDDSAADDDDSSR